MNHRGGGSSSRGSSSPQVETFLNGSNNLMPLSEDNNNNINLNLNSPFTAFRHDDTGYNEISTSITGGFAYESRDRSREMSRERNPGGFRDDPFYNRIGSRQHREDELMHNNNMNSNIITREQLLLQHRDWDWERDNRDRDRDLNDPRGWENRTYRNNGFLSAGANEFVTPPSLSFQCPVCHDLIQESMILSGCNHSFCSQCIYLTFQNEKNCPLCRHHFNFEDIHPNLALRDLVQEIMVYCAYKKDGCKATFHLSNKASHEKNCKYVPKMCPHTNRGCRFEGPLITMDSHFQNCAFEQLKSYLDQQEKTISTLTELVKNQAKELSALKNLLVNQDFKSWNFGEPIQFVPQTSDPKPESKTRWPFGDLECQTTLNQSHCGVTALAYHAQDNTLFSGGHDGVTRRWNLETGELLSTFAGHQYTVWSLAYHPSTSRLFSASSDSIIKVWNVADPSKPPLHTLSQHSGRIFSMVLDSDRLYSASSDKTVKVWDLTTLDCLFTYEGHTDAVNVVVKIDQNLLASGSNDNTIKIWNLNTNSCTRIIQCESEVLNLAVGQGYLFCAAYDSKIYVYDIQEDYTLKKVLSGHKWEIWQLIYVDGVLFSGSFDHTIKRWTVTRETIECSATLSGHKGYVHAMAIGNSCLITGCADKTIKIWQST